MAENEQLKRRLGGLNDSRGPSGIMARGKNIYMGGSPTANSGAGSLGGPVIDGGGGGADSGNTIESIVQRFMAMAPQPPQPGVTDPSLGQPAPINPAAMPPQQDAMGDLGVAQQAASVGMGPPNAGQMQQGAPQIAAILRRLGGA